MQANSKILKINIVTIMIEALILGFSLSVIKERTEIRDMKINFPFLKIR
jgi:hypothetical protein